MAGSLSVMVTRPLGQAQALCDAIVAAGFTAHSLPLLQLIPQPEPLPVQHRLLLELDSFQHVIFVSGNAVRFGMAWIESCWPQLPVDLNWYAVGEASGGLLQGFGIPVLTPGAAMSSEGLLNLPQLQQISGDRVLIIKGEGGRQALAQELGRRGARVDELACYRRAPPDLDTDKVVQKLLQWEIELVLISSAEGLDNLLALLRPAETTKFVHIALLVPSRRIAQMAQEAGFSRVITAENASDKAMLHALVAWQNTVGE